MHQKLDVHFVFLRTSSQKKKVLEGKNMENEDRNRTLNCSFWIESMLHVMMQRGVFWNRVKIVESLDFRGESLKFHQIGSMVEKNEHADGRKDLKEWPFFLNCRYENM